MLWDMDTPFDVHPQYHVVSKSIKSTFFGTKRWNVCSFIHVNANLIVHCEKTWVIKTQTNTRWFSSICIIVSIQLETCGVVWVHGSLTTFSHVRWPSLPKPVWHWFIPANIALPREYHGKQETEWSGGVWGWDNNCGNSEQNTNNIKIEICNQAMWDMLQAASAAGSQLLMKHHRRKQRSFHVFYLMKLWSQVSVLQNTFRWTKTCTVRTYKHKCRLHVHSKKKSAQNKKRG